jgi:putative FmdB family regulatory protein
MPTYQYHCPHCRHDFEEFQSMNDDPIDVCPKCQGKPHRIITGGAGFLFKGSGFYITDNRSKDYKSKADADKPASSPASPPPSSSSTLASPKPKDSRDP